MGKAGYWLFVPFALVGAAGACEGRSTTRHGSTGDAGEGGNAQTGGRSPSGGAGGQGVGGGARGGTGGSDDGGDSSGSGAPSGAAGQGGMAGQSGEAGSGGSDPSCPEAHANCDGDDENGCETNLENDPSNCGRCGRFCGNGTCEEGSCGSCDSGGADCDGDLVCDPLDTEAACGACGHRACTFQNTIATCSRGTACLPPSCLPGYANCSGDYACETAMTGSSETCYPAPLSNITIEAVTSEPHVAVGVDGSTIVAGSFVGEADFDPTSAVDLHVATGAGGTVFVSKYSPTGLYSWTRIFDGGESSVGRVQVGSDGSLILAGAHSLSTDFDPGPGTAIRESETEDAYVVKLLPDGSLDWVRTFPAYFENGNSHATDLALDSTGAIYATGVFQGHVDFDTIGPNGDLVTEPRSQAPMELSEKAFVVKHAPNGAFEWVWSHSGGGSSYGSGLSAEGDRIWLAGSFYEDCRFDASVPATRSNTEGTFALSLSPSRTFQGHALFLLEYAEPGARVTSTANSVFLTTSLDGSADLDPGSGVDWRALHYGGLVAVKLGQDGAHAWSQTFRRYFHQADLAVTSRDGLLVPAAGPWLSEDESATEYRGVVFLVNADVSPGFTLDLGARAIPYSVALRGGLLAVAGHLRDAPPQNEPRRFYVARYAYDE